MNEVSQLAHGLKFNKSVGLVAVKYITDMQVQAALKSLFLYSIDLMQS